MFRNSFTETVITKGIQTSTANIDVSGDGWYDIDIYSNSTSALIIGELFFEDGGLYRRIANCAGSANIWDDQRRITIRGLPATGVRLTVTTTGNSVFYTIARTFSPKYD